jgi:predicted Rossmann fold nucleotide-binding protein DprA/Smf involved in DNA uptake
LLKRGTALALAVERWHQLGIRVIGRGDEGYPSLLKARLRGAAAPVLFVAGEMSLLNGETLAVVGSRDATGEGLSFARQLGKQCAADCVAIVSGDARGIDRAAMDGALDNHGGVIGVLAETLAKSVLTKRNRDALLHGQLLLLSPYDPDAPFSVAHAMDRNKYIYALATAAVVVDSDIKGGTWSGAVENLEAQWAPAFVRIGPEVPLGNIELCRRGLIALNHVPPDLLQALNKIRLNPPPPLELPSQTPTGEGAGELLEYFLGALRAWLSKAPKSEQSIAEYFGLERSQVKHWLAQAEARGFVAKSGKPARYTAVVDAPQERRLL